MSTARIPEQLTVEEFLTRPERGDGLQEELIEGEVTVSPNAKKRHNDAVRTLDRKLSTLENHGFLVLGEVACRLSQTSLPNTDAAVFRKERWDAVDPDDFTEEAPALAVEVVSPGNRDPKLMTKVDLYLSHGSEQVWLVYPKTRTVIVFYQNGEQREIRAGELITFYDVQFDVSSLFE